jgi:hypothetical protein
MNAGELFHPGGERQDGDVEDNPPLPPVRLDRSAQYELYRCKSLFGVWENHGFLPNFPLSRSTPAHSPVLAAFDITGQ